MEDVEESPILKSCFFFFCTVYPRIFMVENKTVSVFPKQDSFNAILLLLDLVVDYKRLQSWFFHVSAVRNRHHLLYFDTRKVRTSVDWVLILVIELHQRFVFFWQWDTKIKGWYSWIKKTAAADGMISFSYQLKLIRNSSVLRTRFLYSLEIFVYLETWHIKFLG